MDAPYEKDQTTVSGRDGELDDWGQKWSKKGKEVKRHP